MQGSGNLQYVYVALTLYVQVWMWRTHCGECVCGEGSGEPGAGSMLLYMLHAVQVVPRLTNIQVLYETTWLDAHY